jgi:hypothetical protein
MLYHNFNILNLSNLINHNWSLEAYNTKDKKNLNILKNNNYGFSWVTPDFLYTHRDFLIKEGCFLIYHIDR